MRIPPKSIIITAIFILGMTLSTHAQVVGIPPFGSFTGGPDLINEANLDVHYTIPITPMTSPAVAALPPARRSLPPFLALAETPPQFKASFQDRLICRRPIRTSTMETSTPSRT
jgi:hypothetical protein